LAFCAVPWAVMPWRTPTVAMCVSANMGSVPNVGASTTSPLPRARMMLSPVTPNVPAPR
jgi:hypothetical protein